VDPWSVKVPANPVCGNWMRGSFFDGLASPPYLEEKEWGVLRAGPWLLCRLLFNPAHNK